MRLFDWFKKESVEDAVAGAIQLHSGDRIKGLDISAAVTTHQKWKERLFHYVSGASSEALDHIAICRDDACALGKWIHGEGRVFLGEQPEYHKLKAVHASFHISAGEIIEAVNGGNVEKAEKLLVEGNFSMLSRDVQMGLARIHAKFGG